MNPASNELARLHVHLKGAVQGVGFRPFVYRLATSLDLKGWVLNSATGLIVETEGPLNVLAVFRERLSQECPPAARITSQEEAWLDFRHDQSFEIRLSEDDGDVTTAVLPDLATCSRCRSELLDPSDRRCGYPFTNCTNCGPRFTIITGVPYDRPNTTMREFVLCEECAHEYRDPADRRFHAQPNACPQCGPHLWTEPDFSGGGPVEQAAQALSEGSIVALKGIGGFQLLCDARSSAAVGLLRQRKDREEKPFAVMMPSLTMVRQFCEVSEAEATLLESTAAPIVLLRPRRDCAESLAPEVAKSSPFLGVMLPYSPLHHLLMCAYPHPLVATSGNRSDEPIAIHNQEARERLGDLCDRFLFHNRPIARPADDSVARVVAGAPQIVRRARGYAPLPVTVKERLPRVLAVGGHLKNTVAIGWGDQVVLSQHVGDLDTYEARLAFERAIEDLCRLYRFEPEIAVCDLHPDYASTIWARQYGLPVLAVQHHQAHVAGCAAENFVEGPYLGVGWDGTGFGEDGTIWGGEFFRVEDGEITRIAYLRPFPLPGGEAAVKEGWRAASGLLFAWKGAGAVPESPFRGPLIQMLERDVNAPLTSSVGRLFDAIAAITAVAHRSRFEGQAAMELERAATLAEGEEAAYRIAQEGREGDWGPLVESVQSDLATGVAISAIAARFHNALATWIVEVARASGLKQVVLSGGVFQNALLTGRAVGLLDREGFRVYQHRSVPPNDGGLSLGQAVLGAHRMRVSGRGVY